MTEEGRKGYEEEKDVKVKEDEEKVRLKDIQRKDRNCK